MKRLLRYTVVLVEDPDIEYERNQMADISHIIGECEKYPNEPERRNLAGSRPNVLVVCDKVEDVEDDDVPNASNEMVHVNYK